MSKKVAVVSDAALHLVTYRGKSSEFFSFKLGGLLELPIDYNDERRARVNSSLTSTLLLNYDVIVRCDVDEFIIPDPRKYKSLREYIERLERYYVTALGIPAALKRQVRSRLPRERSPTRKRAPLVAGRPNQHLTLKTARMPIQKRPPPFSTLHRHRQSAKDL
jgi:hypothetical protein